MASLNCYPTFIPNPELFLLKSIYHDFFFLFQAEQKLFNKEGLATRKENLNNSVYHQEDRNKMD